MKRKFSAKASNYKPKRFKKVYKKDVYKKKSLKRKVLKKPVVYQTVKDSNFTTKSSTYKFSKPISKGLLKFSKLDSKFQRSGDATAKLTTAIGRQAINIVSNLTSATDLSNQLGQMGGLATTDWLITKMASQIELHNQENCGAKVWIYDVLCKQDDSAGPVNDWATGLNTDQGAGVNKHQLPYVKPTLSKQFNNNWTVLKCTQLNLAAGQSHIHNFTWNCNKKVSKDIYETAGTYIKGLTVSQMIVSLGTLNNDTITKGTISYGAVSLNVYVRSSWRFQTVFSNSTTSVIDSGLPTAFPNGEYTMIEDSDIAGPAVTA